MKTNSELKSEINRKDANEIELLKYIGELEHELRTCKKILLEANELLRSAYAIAQRNGEQTNWEAFRTQLQKALQAQHESGLTKRAPDRLWRGWAGRNSPAIITFCRCAARYNRRQVTQTVLRQRKKWLSCFTIQSLAM